MKIAELNYCEAVAANEVTGGWGSQPTFREYTDLRLDLKTNVSLDDNSAEVDALSTALGARTFTKIFSDTYTDSNTSQSRVLSAAATDDFFS